MNLGSVGCPILKFKDSFHPPNWKNLPFFSKPPFRVRSCDVAAGSKVLGATFSRKINLLISKEPAMMTHQSHLEDVERI